MSSPVRSQQAAGRLQPVGLPAEAEGAVPDAQQPPPAGIALRLAAFVGEKPGSVIFLASSERRAEETTRALAGFLPDVAVLHFPAWDCLPYDRAPPSRELMGRRMSVLRQCLLSKDERKVVVLSPEAILQRLPPLEIARTEVFELATGAPLDRDTLQHFALRSGYMIDDRVDEPGEIAFRGNVIDIFPADADEPVRISDADGVIETMMRFDPRTQLTIDEVPILCVVPASEVILDADRRTLGNEHRLAEYYTKLATIFDFVPKARFVSSTLADERLAKLQEQNEEARATLVQLEDAQSDAVDALYLDAAAWTAMVKKHLPQAVDLDGLEPVPAFSNLASPERAAIKFIAEQSEDTVIVCGTEAERKRLSSLLKRNKLEPLGTVDNIVSRSGKAGIWLAPFDLDAGVHDPSAHLTLIAAADILGVRLNAASPDLSSLVAPLELRVGDVVVHEDYGVGILHDLTRVKTDGVEQDTIDLQYHDRTRVMVPVTDFGKLWRYGADSEAVTLDRLNTDAWARKRATVSAEVDAAARDLAVLAQKRLEAKAMVIKPPKASYNRLAARFPYPETDDQTQAIGAVLQDLASGRPMNRLICGDVGFGKTEIALRAAAAVALSGHQVVLVVPTTVLARQHLQSFERRFAGTDIKVATLSRLNSPAETRDTKTALRDGHLDIVIATHSIAAADNELADLGLVIIDEEQRFGARLKHQLQDMAKGAHFLSLSATPIPRSMQAAMIGLQDVSVLATPPARRRPIRTFLMPFDPSTAAAALMREARRSGQSFVVVPRIEDIEPVRSELAAIVPDLSIITVHGELKPQEIDKALLGFANGEGDILLATSIIESGLDVPRANTMLVWRADRFGLAQLHQLRGRVGRARTQGVAYLFTSPDADVAQATRARLSTLEAFDRLGSGFQISARDLELRGGGDLLGENQAGHVHLIGSALYQQLLEYALAQAKNQPVAVRRVAELNIGSIGAIPVDYVPEAVTRINLYARLQRLSQTADLEEFAGELEDRFGPLPDEVRALVDATQLSLLAGEMAIARIDAGPLAIAITPRKKGDLEKLAERLAGEARAHDDRLIFERDVTVSIVDQVLTILGN